MKSHFAYILSAILLTPTAVFAQSGASSDAEDEIAAAMRALDEASSMLGRPSQTRSWKVTEEEGASQKPALAVKSASNQERSQEKGDAQDALAALAALDNHAEAQRAQEAAAALEAQRAQEALAALEAQRAQEAAAALEAQRAQEAAAALEAQRAQEAAAALEAQRAQEALAALENAKKNAAAAAAKSYDVQTAPVPGTMIAKADKADKGKTAPKPTAPSASLAASENKKTALPEKSNADKPYNVQAVPAAKNNAPDNAEKFAAQAAKPEKSAAAPKNAASVMTKGTVQGAASQTLPMEYVQAIYSLNGVDIAKSVGKAVPSIAELYQYAFGKKLVYQSQTPAIGDLAFFHNTADRNRDGRWNDWHTLIGIVESIDENKTISVLVYRKDKIERLFLNLKYPELARSSKGAVLNSQIRQNEGGQTGTSAKLFAGFANLLGDASSFTVIDNWQPGMKVK